MRKCLFLLAWAFAGAQVVCDDDCSKILGTVNQERAKVGKKALCINSLLMMGAQKQAEYQARIKQMTHTGEGGSTVGQRVSGFGYKWSSVAENVAYGQTTPREVMLGWMNSPGHRANILSDNTEMGIARVGNYWAQTFGAPRSGSGGCDIVPLGGALGTLEAAPLDVGPRCTGLCPQLLAIINSKRAAARMRAVCISPKLMSAAAKVVRSSKQTQDFRAAVGSTGFGAKTLAVSMQTVRSSAGPPSDKDILSLFPSNFKGVGQAADSTFTRVGIASDSRRENWYMIFASTYTPDLDQCEGSGSTEGALLPPPAVPPTPQAPVSFAGSQGCGTRHTPCECTGACGWSSTTGTCVAGEKTDCMECPSLSECLRQPLTPTATTSALCAQKKSPCECVGACGWSSTIGQCLTAGASITTDCSECPTQEICLAGGRT